MSTTADKLKPVMVIRSTLITIVVVLCVLSLFLNASLIGYAMIGAGLTVITYGVENRVKHGENVTLGVSFVVALIFFAFAVQMLT